MMDASRIVFWLLLAGAVSVLKERRAFATNVGMESGQPQKLAMTGMLTIRMDVRMTARSMLAGLATQGQDLQLRYRTIQSHQNVITVATGSGRRERNAIIREMITMAVILLVR